MQSMWMRRLGLAAVFGTVAYASIGCAQERDPRNFVQPNAIDKTFFLGADIHDTKDDPEFYMRQTITDVPYGAGVDGLFVGSPESPLSRIKWEVQLNYLIARMTHERVENSDHKGSKRTNDGTIVAVFRIESHFDIKRSYNPSTGEDLNIIEENASDRQWYDRQYIRVDWSQNLVSDAYQSDLLSQLGAFGSVTFSPLAYKVEDPNDPNRPVIEPGEGYLDVTTKVFAQPEIWHTQWGNYPACFFSGQAPVTNCNPSEATVRVSFKKVVDTDYEPVEVDGKQMEAFGSFLEERFSYDRNFGLVDQNWHRFGARHNIWEKSHIEGSQCGVDFWRDENGKILKYKKSGDDFARDDKGMPILDPNGEPYASTVIGKDAHRDENNNKTEDECEFHDKAGNLLHAGAYCDVATKKCSLPLYERKLKTTAWYYGPSSNVDLFPSTADALNQWNVAIKSAALLGMKAEAERVGAQIDPKVFGTDAAKAADVLANLDDEDAVKNDQARAQAEHGLPAIPDVFVLCHNPTIDSDSTACMKKAEDGSMKPVFARIGDIRYNSINLIETPQQNGLWGIMVDAVDPLTGEKVAASVNEYIQTLDRQAKYHFDLLRWINGEISDSQIASGQYLRDWVSASQLGDAPMIPKTLQKSEIQARMASVDKTITKMNGLTPADDALPAPLRRQKANETLANRLGPSASPELAANRKKLLGSRWETSMVTPEMLALAGLPANTPAADETALNMASPLRGRDPEFLAWREREREIGLAKRNACMIFEQPEPTALVGLARMAQRDYPNPDPTKGGACAYDDSLDQKADYPACKAARDKKLLQWLRERFHLGVIAHEMGHSMALRHNFTGSADAFNYHQEYWQLRTRNGEEKACDNSVDPHTNGADCVGPRWVDPVTEDEVNGMIWRFGRTTVMDYPGDAVQDMMGLGSYDKAAMRFMYGHVADVDEDAVVGADKGDAFIQALDGTYYMGVSVGDIHYSKLNDKWKLIDKTRPCTPIPGAKADSKNPLDFVCPRYSKEGPEVPVGRGHRLLHPSLKDMKTVPKYPSLGDALLKLRPDLVANFAVYEIGEGKNKKQLVRHPYTFSSDEYADIGNIPVYRDDAGADPYEMMNFLITSYENRYIFTNFRRDSSAFFPGAAVDRIISRYWSKIHGMAKSFFLAAENAKLADFENVDNLQAISLATADAFQMFIRGITRPEPGTYVVDKSGPTKVARILSPAELQDNPSGDFKIAVGSGEGRYINNDYDYSKGELWYQYPTVAGSYYEKIYGLYFLLEAENHYVSNSKEDYIDGRYKNTNFTNIYPNQVRRLLANLTQNDVTSLGPYTSLGTGTLSNNKVARVQYMPWHIYDELDPKMQSLDYPSDAVVLNPLYSWNQQQIGLEFMFMFGNTKLTMDTAAQARIFSPGDGATVSIPASEQVRYTDPFSSITYVAKNFGTETVNSKNTAVMRTPAARMLQYANQLAEQTFQTSGKEPTGELTFVRDASGNPVCKAGVDCSTLSAKLKAFSSNIDTARQISLWWGYGPL